MLGLGYLSVETLKGILLELEPKLNEEQLMEIVDEVDEDGSGTIDFDGNTHKSTVFKWNRTCVINDPLGQTHSVASSDHYFLLFCFARSEKWRRTDERTTCAKIVITTGRDCGTAEWINKYKNLVTHQPTI